LISSHKEKYFNQKLNPQEYKVILFLYECFYKKEGWLKRVSLYLEAALMM